MKLILKFLYILKRNVCIYVSVNSNVFKLKIFSFAFGLRKFSKCPPQNFKSMVYLILLVSTWNNTIGSSWSKTSFNKIKYDKFAIWGIKSILFQQKLSREQKLLKSKKLKNVKGTHNEEVLIGNYSIFVNNFFNTNIIAFWNKLFF